MQDGHRRDSVCSTCLLEPVAVVATNQCLHHVLDTLFADLISIISDLCGYQ